MLKTVQGVVMHEIVYRRLAGQDMIQVRNCLQDQLAAIDFFVHCSMYDHDRRSAITRSMRLTVSADKPINDAGNKPNHIIAPTREPDINSSTGFKSAMACIPGLTGPVNSMPMVRMA